VPPRLNGYRTRKGVRLAFARTHGIQYGKMSDATARAGSTDHFWHRIGDAGALITLGSDITRAACKPRWRMA
jgi:hypothetical protein